MKADFIIKNAAIYTVDEKMPWAEAMAVKDGKLLYVGSDEGAAAFDGPVKDMQGQFVMPGLVDSHVHVGISSYRLHEPDPVSITGVSCKADVLAFIEAYLLENKKQSIYNFYLSAADLHGDSLTRYDLDVLPTEAPIHIGESEQHSIWVNTAMMKRMGVDEYEPDIAPGQSYYERDSEGKVNGRMFEFCQIPKRIPEMPEDFYDEGVRLILEFWKKIGVIAAFDAGMVGPVSAADCFYRTVKKFDEKGSFPIYLEGCHMLTDPLQFENAVETLQKLDAANRSEHQRVRTMKMFLDGTANARTAALFAPYADGTGNGKILMDVNRMTDFLLELNEAGLDFHLHTVGERAAATVLDAVEAAKKQAGDSFRIQVTCAHLECLPDELLGRFKELGVIANFTPNWFGGGGMGNYEGTVATYGEKRADHMYRANSIWNTGATVAFSTDYIAYDNMKHWNPYMGIEVGITRQDNIPAMLPMQKDYSGCPVYPCNEEKLSLAQMIKGYTLNAAKQMRLDDKIGSLKAGKDASFLVFEKSLFDLDVYQIHNQLPKEIYIQGKKIND